MAKGIDDINKDMAASRKYYEEVNRLLEEEKRQLFTIFNMRKKNAINAEIQANNQKISNELQSKTNEYLKNGEKLHGNTLKAVAKQRAELYKQNRELDKKIIRQRKISNGWKNILVQSNKLYNSLISQDKIIRQTILSLGMSGQKAEMIRQSFEGSASQVALLGGNMESIQKIMTGYADETGRARILTKQMVIDTTEIGLGTGIGVENAVKLAGQFEIMGVDVAKTKSLVQGMVDSGEKFGINTRKALEKLNQNFKTLNTFTFQGGVRAMGEMALYAEQMKIDMSATLKSAEGFRKLDKSIESAAKLQTLGGEFAKSDPLELLFLARNAPERFQKKLGEMTKGLITMRKMSDGTFEKFISPADIDRLAVAGEALGYSKEQLVEMAQRQYDMGKMSNLLGGKGLSKDQQEVIKGLAQFDSKSGKYMVQVGDYAKSITDLTSQDIKALDVQKSTLEQRAKDAQDFETALKQTILGLKATLLPALRGVNRVLEWARPIAEGFVKWVDWATKTDFGKMFLTGAGMFLLGARIFKGVTGRGVFSNIGRSRVSGGGNLSGSASRSKALASRARGGAILKGGAGIGAAGLGVGAGIGAAAFGISQLADSIKNVDVEKLKIMNNTLLGLGIGIGTIVAVSPLLAKAVPALYAIGGGVALIGAGIGVAAAGIGYMGQGLADLVIASKEAGPAMLQVGAGVAAINATMGMGAVGGLLGGFKNFKKTIELIADKAPGIERVGSAFKSINAVMTGNKEDFEHIRNLVTEIASTNISKNSVFSELSNLLKNPLKVEFDDTSKANLVSNITLEIDGEKFMNKVYKHKIAVQKQVDLVKQKAS